MRRIFRAANVGSPFTFGSEVCFSGTVVDDIQANIVIPVKDEVSPREAELRIPDTKYSQEVLRRL